MLIILSGLPGTGKSTIAERLCRKLPAVHIRIDTIEQALREAGPLSDDSPAGYLVGYAVARDCLRLGHIVVADSVNPVAESRHGWRAVGKAAGISVLEVEIICSDVSEHRHRVETRTSDVEGLVKPTWAQVETRTYERWENQPDLVLDTAHDDADRLALEIAGRVRFSSRHQDL